MRISIEECDSMQTPAFRNVTEAISHALCTYTRHFWMRLFLYHMTAARFLVGFAARKVLSKAVAPIRGPGSGDGQVMRSDQIQLVT